MTIKTLIYSDLGTNPIFEEIEEFHSMWSIIHKNSYLFKKVYKAEIQICYSLYISNFFLQAKAYNM